MLNFLRLFFCICISCSYVSVHGFFKIVEVFPNTIDDKNLEYVIIKNTSSQIQSLEGYILADKKKQYVFPKDIPINPGEKRQFLRPETKLILNNSNEILTLHNTENLLIDEVSYEKSIKGDFLSFQNIEDIGFEDFISSEVFISGEIFFSDEVAVSAPNIVEEGVGKSGEIIGVGSGSILIEEIDLRVPQLVFTLQRPSYIQQSGITGVYICDPQRDTCRVNFNLLESFSQDFPERDYMCNIDFGLSEITLQEGRCNPNTVTFPQGIFEVIFTIYHEDDESIFSEKKIIIQNENIGEKNTLAEQEEDIEQIEGTKSQSGGEGEIISNENGEKIQGAQDNIGQDRESEEDIGVKELSGTQLFVPQPVFTLQRPSYIEQSGIAGVYICDPQRDTCRVNFNLLESFSQEFPEQDYLCDIDFGLSEITLQEERCNPNTVTFPQGIFEVIFTIYHEDDESVFSEKKIIIQNLDKKNISQEIVHTESGDIQQVNTQDHTQVSHKSGNIQQKILIDTPIFEIQKGLTRRGSRFYCDKNECKINLNYIEKHESEKCFWHFGKGVASSKTTHTRCNPGYIAFTPGIHKISLEVYQDDYIYNRESRVFTIYNLGDIINIDTPENIGNIENIPENKYAYIILQGKISKEKILQGDILYCMGVEKCNVNLKGQVLDAGSNLEYMWKLDGEIFSHKKNPSGLWLTQGVHVIDLLVMDGDYIVSQDNFYVSVDSSQQGYLQQDAGEIDISQKEKKNTKKYPGFTQNFLLLKYDGLRISGKAPLGSSVEIYYKSEKILSQKVNKQGKYRLVSKDFNPGEYIFDTKIILDSGKEIFIQNSGSTQISADKRNLWFQTKGNKKRVSSLRESINKRGNVVVKSSKNKQEYIVQMPFYHKIFLLLILSLGSIFGGLHLLSYRGDTILN